MNLASNFLQDIILERKIQKPLRREGKGRR
jgi:hypothetical protein